MLDPNVAPVPSPPMTFITITSLIPAASTRTLSVLAQVAPAPPGPAAGAPPAPNTTTAQPSSSSSAPGGVMGTLMQFALPLAIFAGFYFLMIRPQQAKAKELDSKLKKGDRVVTQSGIIGKIHTLGDKEVTLEVAPNVRIDMLRPSITSVYEGDVVKKTDATDLKDVKEAKK